MVAVTQIVKKKKREKKGKKEKKDRTKKEKYSNLLNKRVVRALTQQALPCKRE
jgi:hypothetical protein